MKEKVRLKVQQVKNNPKVKAAVLSAKPSKNIWGISGVLLFFIVPEIVAFMYGEEIVAYAQTSLSASEGVVSFWYEALIFLFESGGSWLNLIVGVMLLVWLFF